MRVYVFTQHYPNPYKPWIDTQLVTMLEAGHDVTVFATGSYTSTISDEVRAHGLERRTHYYPTTLKTLKKHGGAVAAAIARHPFAQVKRALRTLDRRRSLKLNLMAAARSAVLPVQPPDICYIHDLVTATSLTFLKHIYPEAQVCLHFHGAEVGGVAPVRTGPATFDSVHAVVCGTQYAATLAAARGCAMDKVAIVPVGFNLKDYEPPAGRSYAPDGVVRLISVGRMSPEKGILFALDAVRQLVAAGKTRFTYRLVGVGIQYEELRAYVRDHGLEHVVTFAGEKTRAQVATELANADVLLLPSIITDQGAETQAAVVQEALLMGCLTIATNTGGVPESNAQVMHQFAVPHSDAGALAESISRVLTLTPEAMRALAREGRAFAAANYDIEILMKRILEHAAGRRPAAPAAQALPAAMPSRGR